MQTLPSFSRALALAGLALGIALPAMAQLAANSPFMPPQAPGAATPAQQAPLEFVGYFTVPDGIMYVVRDPAKKTSVFLKPNERDSILGVVMKQYDANMNTLTIEQDGRTLTLEARKSKIVSSGAPAMVMAAPMPLPQPAVANVSPAITQSVVLNPTPADEQKRLEAVASEVARRRALREQAAQQAQNAAQNQSAQGRPR